VDTRTDFEIIQAVLNGNQEPFSELVNRYTNLVFSIIRRQTRDYDEAHDLSQEIFLKVYRNLGKYTPEFKFSTWIMKITSNHIIDNHRRKRFETVSYEEYTEGGGYLSGEAIPSPEAEVIQRDQARRISKIVDGLPESYKIPIMLYHQQGLSYQSISEKTGEPLSKVKNRIFRGRKMLKTLLDAEV
jgi:RNA polymerase sigma-70 factor (ECF subfamily)